MIESDAIEGVVQRQDALDFMGLDHGRQQIVNGERGHRLAAPGQIIGNGQNPAQVIAGMPPLRGKPGVIEIKPAYQASNVECRLHGIEFKMGSRHPRPTGQDCPRHDRSQPLNARGEFQRQQHAPQAVHQTQLRGVIRLAAVDCRVGNIVRDQRQDFIGGGPLGASLFQSSVLISALSLRIFCGRGVPAAFLGIKRSGGDAASTINSQAHNVASRPPTFIVEKPRASSRAVGIYESPAKPQVDFKPSVPRANPSRRGKQRE